MEKRKRVKDLYVISCRDFDYWSHGIGVAIHYGERPLPENWGEWSWHEGNAHALLIAHCVFRKCQPDKIAPGISSALVKWIREEKKLILPRPLYQKLHTDVLEICRDFHKNSSEP